MPTDERRHGPARVEKECANDRMSLVRILPSGRSCLYHRTRVAIVLNGSRRVRRNLIFKRLFPAFHSTRTDESGASTSHGGRFIEWLYVYPPSCARRRRRIDVLFSSRRAATSAVEWV